ncbi:MAG: hypothetical protein B7Z66_02660 [Chromatiales bacterium 21-64-14]|nr:MAG: hypothetical protein B7Z66_02660 [Chromatiales bacterium 21-64-14]HQU14524.1 lipoprotein [Gammaproteobacteria bacterium]
MPDQLPRILPWILAAVLVAAPLSGCGQKGPLYLPPAAQPAQHSDHGRAHEPPRPAPQP